MENSEYLERLKKLNKELYHLKWILGKHKQYISNKNVVSGKIHEGFKTYKVPMKGEFCVFCANDMTGAGVHGCGFEEYSISQICDKWSDMIENTWEELDSEPTIKLYLESKHMPLNKKKE